MAVLRTGSLSAAARLIGLTQPTVGRHIDALEDHFGTLFVRSQSGFAPTELAIRLRTYAESIESEVAALTREASLKKSLQSGTVRITASEIVGSEILPSILARLHIAFPNIQIELMLSDQTENLLTREADIAIRMFDPQQKALIAKKLGNIEVSLHAHKDYLKRRGTPKRVEDLANHSLIGFDRETEFIRSVQNKLGKMSRSEFSFRTDSGVAQLAMVRAGFGIGFFQRRLAQKDPTLERVLPGHLVFKMPTWIVMHENLKSNPICLVVFNHVRDELLAHFS